jgi:hypothetical protein
MDKRLTALIAARDRLKKEGSKAALDHLKVCAVAYKKVQIEYQETYSNKKEFAKEEAQNAKGWQILKSQLLEWLKTGDEQIMKDLDTFKSIVSKLPDGVIKNVVKKSSQYIEQMDNKYQEYLKILSHLEDKMNAFEIIQDGDTLKAVDAAYEKAETTLGVFQQQITQFETFLINS